ncbi:mannose-6-phosphate isomerase, class I [Aureibacter tunicatorum]|uniref:mannose-6-phosphate isomerase n=1 Tax=Aureibacter tunicatorum TaxID=866807 RepID=A0AAE3XKM2_9BACT|nr:mannose-6-phosphate isomerase, class I [Aureibacter tunicatorum]MDR6238622.1 mannose-6-phosphate isomerase [Aureibacter tunicatorum]BDD05447.1 mannose-6-phosphate isomerase [Aureibacter tunicatorum]
MKNLAKIEGKIQHYAWGGESYIGQLLGVDVKGQPTAEYWLGAHDNAPSMVGGEVPLNKLIAEDPNSFLGEKVANQFANKLPYLFKVLDVKDMLSIQVHPTKEEAVKGFARENEEGISLSASNRNYKDDNHKPEIMVALSEFWLLHGFKSEEEVVETLKSVPEFNELLTYFEGNDYKKLYQHIMELPQSEVDRILSPLMLRIYPNYKQGKVEKSSPDYWASKAVSGQTDLNEGLDRGIFSIYLFNIVKAEKGDAIFQDAGVPHAYMEGQNMELMANSDNVLRGGLTPKHIDVSELLKHTKFERTIPNIIAGEKVRAHELAFKSPAADFELSVIKLSNGEEYKNKDAHSTDIVFVLEGDVKASSVSDEIELGKGEAFVVKSDQQYTIQASQDSILYKATVPQN